MVVVSVVELGAHDPHLLQQQGAVLPAQQIVEGVVGLRAEREQGGVVEVARELVAAVPAGHHLHAVQGLVGVAAVAGEQVGADQHVGVGLLLIDDAAAFAREHRVALHLVLEPFDQFRVDVVEGFHGGSQRLVGPVDVDLAVGEPFGLFDEAVPLAAVDQHARVAHAGEAGQEILQGGRAEFRGVLLHGQPQDGRPFHPLFLHVAVLPVPDAGLQVAVGVVKGVAGLHLGHPAAEFGVGRPAQTVAQGAFVHFGLFGRVQRSVQPRLAGAHRLGQRPLERYLAVGYRLAVERRRGGAHFVHQGLGVGPERRGLLGTQAGDEAQRQSGQE